MNPLKFLSVSAFHWYLNSIYSSAFWFTPAAWLTCEGSWAGHTWVATYNCRIRQDRWQWYFSSEWVSDEVEQCFFFPQTSRSTYKLCNHICKTRSNAIEAIIIHDVVVAWKCFLHYWPFVRGIHRSLVVSPHKGSSNDAELFNNYHGQSCIM